MVVRLIERGKVSDIIKLSSDELKKPLINGQSVFSLLISRGDDKTVIKLIKKNNRNALITDDRGDNAAHIATRYDKIELFKSIIKLCPDSLNSQNNFGETPIFFCLHRPELIADIIKNVKDINLNQVNTDGQSALTQTLLLSKEDNDAYSKTALILIKSKKMDLNSPVNNLPIVVAIKRENLKMVQELHRAGADLNLLTSDHISPVNIAITLGKDNIAEYLINNGVDINNSGPEGDDDPFIIALVERRYDIINKMIDSGYDINKKNRFLETACHVILSTPDVPRDLIFKVLSKSDLNIESIDKVTPLHLLMARSDWSVFSEILKKKKLNVFAKDTEERSVISMIKDGDMKLFRDILVESYIDQSPSKKFKKKCESRKCYDRIFNVIIQTKRSYPERGDYIPAEKIPMIREPNSLEPGRFNSDSLHSCLYTLKFLERVNGIFPVFRHTIQAKKDTEQTLMKYTNLRGGDRIVHAIYDYYRKIMYELSCYLIVWRSKDVYFIDQHLNIYVKKLLKNDKIRFIYFKLTLVISNTGTHANIVIYDKKMNRVERFDPYGTIPYLDADALDNMLKSEMKKIFGKDTEYLPPKDYMGVSFQIISNDSVKDVKRLGDPQGYCLAWTFWYLELRVSNPDLHPKALVQMAEREINRKSSSDTGTTFIDFIRNYAMKLDTEKNDLLRTMGINEDNVYRLIFNDIDGAKIIAGLSRVFNRLTSSI